MRRWWVVACVAFLLTACSEAPAPTGAGARADAPEGTATPAAARDDDHAGHDHAAARGRPLAAFEGRTLQGERIAVADLLGKRLLLFLFNPEVELAQELAPAVNGLSGHRAAHNFEIVGIATGSTPPKAEQFAEEKHLEFRVIDDSAARIANRLELRQPVALIGVDADGYELFRAENLQGSGDEFTAQIEAQLRQVLRLPETGLRLEPELGELATAPDFTAPEMDGAELRLSSLRGRAVALIFFLHTCGHCHKALESMRESLESLPEATRPRIVGVSMVNRPDAVKRELQKAKLDFFTVLFDPEGEIRRSYAAVGGVPQIFLIDAEGRIHAKVQGWFEGRDPALTRMRLARLAGAPVPMLLHQTGYSGSEVCGVCHMTEHETWQLTKHSWAFETLVKHGEEKNAECVSCHVVGFGEKGGFDLSESTPFHENVGCESCHGRGGPHLSPDFVPGGEYASVCATCHNPKHSLGFTYAEFLPKVSHAANRGDAALTLEAKRALLAERGRPRKAALPSDSPYVGSDACQECHAAEFEAWSSSPHARALESLAAKGSAGNADCQKCHTTGFDLAGGFPQGASPADHADLARVGCESCHGPGGAHVAEDSRKIGSILSLGDKCDSCVILQLCGSCHDDANDPGFEFEVLDKIELQRHGTIEAGTGKPLDPQAGTGFPRAAWTPLLEHAFQHLDERS